ncbi:polysaccharide deacetylase family protein [Heliophilum fasciatum]|uniref:polysaccharide deacetylase family protein n=1 Tax=Heliophilum fasciatum TaxID=35700 RepID=UPI00140539A5|nr:polysaccharide deacetylase family protein [Heliophilum fasciatum]MCW2277172.1 uncharacterized protein YdaL [Heliophilum fasciatum]
MTRWMLCGMLLISLLVPSRWAEGTVDSAADSLNAGTVKQRVLVLYPSTRWFRGITDDQAEVPAVMVGNLLGHFETDVTIEPSANYQQGDAEHFDRIIYVGTFQEKVPVALLDDLASGSKPLFWLGRNIEQLGERWGQPWQVRLGQEQAVTLHYRGQRLSLDKPLAIDALTAFPPEATLWAEATTQEKPLALGLRLNRLWYFGTADLQDKASLLIADQLYDFLGQVPPVEKSAVIRIEDVHPLRSPANLRALTDTMAARRIPFLVTVIPNYVNPATNQRVTMTERPEFIEALRYMEAHGGSLLVHGYTHQIGDGETGVGFEFWDTAQEEPVRSQAEPDWAWARLNRTVGLLQQQGLHPRGVTLPHYAVDQKTYGQIRQNFDLVVGAPQVTERTRQTQKIPYLIRQDKHGFRVIPENIGYIDMNLADPIPPMLAAAQENSLVRGCTVSAFYHSFLDEQRLGALLDGLQGQGFRFTDQPWHGFSARYLPELDSRVRVDADPLREEVIPWIEVWNRGWYHQQALGEMILSGFAVCGVLILCGTFIRRQDLIIKRGKGC